MSQSHLEAELLAQLKLLGLPEPELEYRFAPPRRYRADLAWPAVRLLIEIEGGLHSRKDQGPGRHVRPKGYESDCRKYNLAVLRGYRVLRFTARQIRSGEAFTTIESALET